MPDIWFAHICHERQNFGRCTWSHTAILWSLSNPICHIKLALTWKISPEKYNFIVRTNYRHPKMDVTEFKQSSEKNNEQWKTVFLLGNFRPDAL